jgi:hypothetical protein
MAIGIAPLSVDCGGAEPGAHLSRSMAEQWPYQIPKNLIFIIISGFQPVAWTAAASGSGKRLPLSSASGNGVRRRDQVAR